jgi:DNA (cytosine-5)-methyltransferase 1
MESKHKFPYEWYLKNGYPAANIEKNSYKVFGTFICGGGSTMGYKLAGFEHLGGVEIDTKVADVYQANHNPKYLYNMDIRAFNEIENLPSELYNLDILDGSPPCSTFSMVGSREKAWSKKKQFREGQAEQILDDLVFVYCETIKKLMPKVFILENVTGILRGNAKAYSKEIGEMMENAGYKVQVFQLNAASMGVPQKRERAFFIGYKKEFKLPKLDLSFNEKPIPLREIGINGKRIIAATGERYALKGLRPTGDSNYDPAYTITASGNSVDYCDRIENGSFVCPKKYNEIEVIKIGTFPLDCNFKELAPKYLIGMSVPPVMTAQISHQIKLQWLDKIK